MLEEHITNMIPTNLDNKKMVNDFLPSTFRIVTHFDLQKLNPQLISISTVSMMKEISISIVVLEFRRWQWRKCTPLVLDLRKLSESSPSLNTIFSHSLGCLDLHVLSLCSRSSEIYNPAKSFAKSRVILQ